MWNATHAARYTASQGKIVVNGLLHFKFPEWQRHASALVAGVSKGHSTSLQPAISVTQVTDARSANEAGEMIQNLWRERRLTNIEVLAGAFYKTTNFGPAMSCKALLSLLEFAKIQIPPEGRYTPQEISNRKQRRILFDQPDEFEAYWNAARNAWAPLGSCKPEAAWQILELMGMHFDDPKSFACGDELSRYACVARWLAAEVHRKTETGRSTGHQRSIKPPSPGSKS
jgi:hypothetical protein